MEAAGYLPVPQQPLCRTHEVRELHGGGQCRDPRRELHHAVCVGGWERSGRNVAGEPRRGGACPERRSEEHTSELQSLMRISYAVFCLKKQKNIIPPTTINNHKS